MPFFQKHYANYIICETETSQKPTLAFSSNLIEGVVLHSPQLSILGCRPKRSVSGRFYYK